MTRQHGSETELDTFFVIKLWLPLILLSGTAIMLRNAHHPLLIGLPMVLWAAFNLTAVQVRTGARNLQYRRFLVWREIPYEEIRDCRVSWVPAMGCLRLRQRYVLPWGTLYFVLDGPLQVVMPGGQTALTSLINSRRREKQGPSDGGDRSRHCRLTNVLKCLGMMAVGVLLSTFGSILSITPPNQFGAPGTPRWIIFWEQIGDHLYRSPWNVIAGAGLVAGIIYLRFRSRAWILSFGLGGLLGLVVARALQ